MKREFDIIEMCAVLMALKSKLKEQERWINMHVRGGYHSKAFLFATMDSYADTLKAYNKVHELYFSGIIQKFELKGVEF